MIPDKGNLTETAPLKLLLAMDEQNQTGILYFRKNEILKVFYLNQGKISWAISSDEEDKIEHVLLAKKLVSPEALAPYLAGNKISESFGKILVENGLISLETLINASRDQLKRISTSILFWNSGSYQLELESPPTRLVSLELEIIPLVYNYILAHMDVNIIWEELGALSGELQQTSQAEKNFQYTLDAEQQEVFACFHEPQRPETVLLRFPAERKHTILKILYFFLITGLLVKNEAAMMPALDFNELDSLFGNAQPASPGAIIVDAPSMINEADIKDIPQLDLPDIHEPQAITEVSLPKLLDLMPSTTNKAKDQAIEIPLFPKPEKIPTRFQPLHQEKQKSKWLSTSFLSILVSAAAIGLVLWFINTPKKKDQQPTNEPPAAQARQKSPEQQTNAPARQKSDLPAALQSIGPATAQSPITGEGMNSKDAMAKVDSEKIISGLKPQASETQAKPQAAREEIVPAPMLPNSGANARQAFAREDFATAGKLWQQEMLSAKNTHSILLEMDCLKQSVQLAYQQIIDKENFFILSRVKDGRSCWLVLWGKFRTQNEATQNLKLIPEYFFKQSEPPAVIELDPYL
jgi:hypothetical protein